MTNCVFNFLVNDKGGVGKSPTAINLAAFLKAQGRPVVIVDADMRATTMAETFGDAVILGVSEMEVEEGTTSLGDLIRFGREGSRSVIVDTGASVRPILARFFDLVDFPSLAQKENWKVNIISPIDHTRESRIFAERLISTWPWADHWHVHMRTRQTYNPAAYPKHRDDRTIIFPYLPESMRFELQQQFLTMDQAIEKQTFREFLQREILQAARNKFYDQLQRADKDLFFQPSN